jgi:hypothetical protein
MSNFTKIRPVGAELFHAAGRADMMKLIVAFRNFKKAQKNYDELLCRISSKKQHRENTVSGSKTWT